MDLLLLRPAWPTRPALPAWPAGPARPTRITLASPYLAYSSYSCFALLGLLALLDLLVAACALVLLVLLLLRPVGLVGSLGPTRPAARSGHLGGSPHLDHLATWLHSPHLALLGYLAPLGPPLGLLDPPCNLGLVGSVGSTWPYRGGGLLVVAHCPHCPLGPVASWSYWGYWPPLLTAPLGLYWGRLPGRQLGSLAGLRTAPVAPL